MPYISPALFVTQDAPDDDHIQESNKEAIRKTHEIAERPKSSLSVVDQLKDEHIDPEWRAGQRQKCKK